MKSLRFLDRRAGFSLASLGLLLGMVAPAVLPTFASAAQLSSRSIEMSNSTANQSSVAYTITFTPSGASWQHLVIDWCQDSPIIGASCTTPTAFDAKTGVSVSGGAAIGTISLNSGASTGIHTVLDGTSASTATSPVTITLTGVHNPSATGSFYARMYTYSTVDYTSVTNLGTTVDTGGVALSTANNIGVTAAVRETMTFCVSGDVGGSGPTGNCGTDANGGSAVPTTSASITLGHGSPLALDSSAADTAADWTQLSTNAASGANVRMTNSNSCNGLMRAGAGVCDIAGVGGGTAQGTIAGGNALFGMKLSNEGGAPFSVATPTGSLSPTSLYDGSTGYGMGSGVTGTYGDSIMTTSGPVANRNIKLNFAASAAPTTPAGTYKATLNLIATGTF